MSDPPANPPAFEAGAARAEVTRILQSLENEDDVGALLPLVYEQLRAIARGRMANERRDHTLAATALVHEAYLRLLGPGVADFRDRGHFFAAAAEAMRRILIDHARRKGSRKRGGGQAALPLSVVDLAEDADYETVAALDEAIDRLAAEDPQAARVVKLRFFAGLDVAETAEALGLSERTVMREWAFARARLYQLFGGPDS